MLVKHDLNHIQYINHHQQQQIRANKDNKQQSNSTSFGPTPMETAASITQHPHQPINDVVRAYRISNNLCLYCGGNNHEVKDCRSKIKGKQVASSLVFTILASGKSIKEN